MNRLLSWWRRRHDENDVRVHPDTGTLGAPTRHRAPVRGGARDALRQIEAEAPRFQPDPAPAHVFTGSSVRWAQVSIERWLAEAADLESQAFERFEFAGQLRARAADMAAWLQLGAAPAPELFGPQVPLDDDYPPHVTDDPAPAPPEVPVDEVWATTPPRPDAFAWLPTPADVPGARDGNTVTMPVYQAGGAR